MANEQDQDNMQDLIQLETMKDTLRKETDVMTNMHREAKQKEMDAYEKARKEEAAQERAKDRDLLRHKHELDDGKGNKTTRWAEVERAADVLINAEHTSYHSWRSTIMSMMRFGGKIGEALATSKEQVVADVKDYVSNALGIGSPMSDAWIALKSAILHRIKGNSDVNIPALQHKVTFDNGTVNIADLKRSDGIAFDQQDEATAAFKEFVALWLGENGYIPHENEPGKYVHKDDPDSLLDEDSFNDLNGNPETSLATFLEQAAFTYEQQKEDREDPAPASPSP